MFGLLHVSKLLLCDPGFLENNSRNFKGRVRNVGVVLRNFTKCMYKIVALSSPASREKYNSALTFGSGYFLPKTFSSTPLRGFNYFSTVDHKAWKKSSSPEVWISWSVVMKCFS